MFGERFVGVAEEDGGAGGRLLRLWRGVVREHCVVEAGGVKVCAPVEVYPLVVMVLRFLEQAEESGPFHGSSVAKALGEVAEVLDRPGVEGVYQQETLRRFKDIRVHLRADQVAHGIGRTHGPTSTLITRAVGPEILFELNYGKRDKAVEEMRPYPSFV